MKRSIPFGNISRPISCPGAVLRALSILAYLDNRLTLQHRCALQCCPLFWVSLPAFWPFFFVICYFFWGDEGNLHLACWPGSRLRGSRPFVPGLSLWPDLQFAVYSMPFFFSLSFASFLFSFFFWFFAYLYVYIFHCGLLFGLAGREKFIWFYFHFIWIVLWLLWLDFAPRFVCESWPISMRRLLLSCLLCWGSWWLGGDCKTIKATPDCRLPTMATTLLVAGRPTNAG